MYLHKISFIMLSGLLANCTLLYPQENKNRFIPVAEVFTDFHFAPGNDSIKPGFGISRAWFGADFISENNFRGSVILNMTKLIDTVLHTGNNSPVREASVGYDNGKLRIIMGITGTRIMNYQIKFYDKRYVANTFQSLNGYGYLFDKGLSLDYRISSLAGFDITLMNGEGLGRKPEGSLKASLGINIYPPGDAMVRVYCDTRKVNGLWQTTMTGFAGFTRDVIKIGAEVNYKTNLDKIKGHHAWGVSTTGSVILSDKLQLFGRYDYSSSVIASGDILQWNILKDGQLIILGLQ